MAIEHLSHVQILKGLNKNTRDILGNIQVHETVDSTNSALQRLPLSQQHGSVLLAEQQTAGRGRRGRNWHSPHGQNLYLSLGWQFDQPLASLSCLSLVVALASARALSLLGLQGHKIKWPNDLLLDGRKFCGCLVEVRGDARGPCHVVTGIGINVNMPISESTHKIEQPWTDLATYIPDISRNRLACKLLEALVDQFTLFSRKGFAAFMDEWRKFDGLKGQHVQVINGDQALNGTVTGTTQRGELLLATDGGLLRLNSGEVSVRID